MIYKVIGTGPQFPPGYKSDATTAGEALIKRQATEKHRKALWERRRYRCIGPQAHLYRIEGHREGGTRGC
jgi:hypothetical protein